MATRTLRLPARRESPRRKCTPSENRSALRKRGSQIRRPAPHRKRSAQPGRQPVATWRISGPLWRAWRVIARAPPLLMTEWPAVWWSSTETDIPRPRRMIVPSWRGSMPDRTEGFPPCPGKRMETFLTAPHQHRRVAFKLEQLKDSPEAQFLAKHARFLAKHIQEKQNNSGTGRITRIKGRRAPPNWKPTLSASGAPSRAVSRIILLSARGWRPRFALRSRRGRLSARKRPN